MAIAAQAGAPTAAIAKEAGVSNGSLFTYFETKADLLNQLYLQIKAEAAEAASGGLSAKGDIRKRAQQSWARSLEWAMEFPQKRRVLVLLAVSDDVTQASKAEGHRIMAGVAARIDESRKNGPMRNAPLPFVVAIMNAIMDLDDGFHAPRQGERGETQQGRVRGAVARDCLNFCRFND